MKTWKKTYHQILLCNPPQIELDSDEYEELLKLFKILSASVNLVSAEFRTGISSFTLQELDKILCQLHRFRDSVTELTDYLYELSNCLLNNERNKEANFISQEEFIQGSRFANEIQKKLNKLKSNAL